MITAEAKLSQVQTVRTEQSGNITKRPTIATRQARTRAGFLTITQFESTGRGHYGKRPTARFARDGQTRISLELPCTKSHWFGMQNASPAHLSNIAWCILNNCRVPAGDWLRVGLRFSLRNMSLRYVWWQSSCVRNSIRGAVLAKLGFKQFYELKSIRF